MWYVYVPHVCLMPAEASRGRRPGLELQTAPSDWEVPGRRCICAPAHSHGGQPQALRLPRLEHWNILGQLLLKLEGGA